MHLDTVLASSICVELGQFQMEGVRFGDFGKPGWYRHQKVNRRSI